MTDILLIWMVSKLFYTAYQKKIKQLACICKHGFKKKRVYLKKEDKHQSSKNRVSNSKFRSVICRVFLLILEEYLSSSYIYITFNSFRDFYWLFYSFGKSTVIYDYCYKHSEWQVTYDLNVCVFHIWAS